MSLRRTTLSRLYEITRQGRINTLQIQHTHLMFNVKILILKMLGLLETHS